MDVFIVIGLLLGFTFTAGFTIGCRYTDYMYRKTMARMEQTANYMMSKLPKMGINIDPKEMDIRK